MGSRIFVRDTITVDEMMEDLETGPPLIILPVPAPKLPLPFPAPIPVPL